MTRSPTLDPARPPVRPRLAFVVTEDWFFVSHFLPMLAAARVAGFDPIVVTRVREHGTIIEAAGARLIELEEDRASLDPFAIVRTILRLRRILRRENVRVVHLIALRSIVLGGTAAALAGVRRRVLAVTGGGLLTARTDPAGRLAAAALTAFIRTVVNTRSTRYLFENSDDPKAFGLDPGAHKVTIVGGAGIDPAHFSEQPFPGTPPLRVAIVSRLLWSKGVDLIVDAVTLARERGADVSLSIFGAPDPANPRAIAPERLAEWSARDGIEWRGVSKDVRQVWREHHLACLPSRGGEGLPRTLLEAASCGRAILTTDVSGCRSFVRDGLDGFVVPPDNVAALCDALMSLSRDAGRAQAMGKSARARVLDGYTEEAVRAAVLALYREQFAS